MEYCRNIFFSRGMKSIIIWIIVGGFCLIGIFDYIKLEDIKKDLAIYASGIQYRNYEEYIWPKFLTTKEDSMTQYFRPVENGLSEIHIRLAYNNSNLLKEYGAKICITLMNERGDVIERKEVSSDLLENWRYYVLETKNLEKGKIYSISLTQIYGAVNESDKYFLSYVPFAYDKQTKENVPAENIYCEYNGEKQEYEWDLYYVYRYLDKDKITKLIVMNIIAVVILLVFALLFYYYRKTAFVLIFICFIGCIIYKGVDKYREGQKWYNYISYIAHAMGGIHGITYTNSLEAFELAYSNGFRVFEVDFCMTSDNEIVLGHGWQGMDEYENGYIPTLEEYKAVKLYGQYTTLSIYDLFYLMLEYPDIYIVTDSKLADYNSVRKQFIQLSEILENYTESDRTHIINHCIVQIYNDDMLAAIESVIHFENYIYTLYQRGNDDLDILADFCIRNDISVVTMPYSWWTEENNTLFHKKGLKVFVHTLNDIEEAEKYLTSGVDGIYTDYIIASSE